MALVMTLKEGEEFYIGDVPYVVDEITGRTSFVVMECDGGKRWAVTDQRATEISDDVFLSAGVSHTSNLVRLAFDAPRSLPILRGSRYAEKHPA